MDTLNAKRTIFKIYAYIHIDTHTHTLPKTTESMKMDLSSGVYTYI